MVPDYFLTFWKNPRNLILGTSYLVEWNGRSVEWDGRLVEWDGRLVEWDGRLFEWDGQLVEWDGRLVEWDGRSGMTEFVWGDFVHLM